MNDENILEDQNETQDSSTENLVSTETPEELDVTAQLQQDLDEAKKDHLYLRAEYDNYRKKSIKERSDLIKYAGEKLAVDLLATLDIFETALSGEVTPDNYTNFVEGIKLTSNQLTSTLEKHGIKSMDIIGKDFDPSFHEALSSEVSTELDPGKITRVFKKPYTYHEKLIRPGQVVVAKEPEKATKE